jgi:hypothetical protein
MEKGMILVCEQKAVPVRIFQGIYYFDFRHRVLRQNPGARIQNSGERDKANSFFLLTPDSWLLTSA